MPADRNTGVAVCGHCGSSEQLAGIAALIETAERERQDVPDLSDLACELESSMGARCCSVNAAKGCSSRWSTSSP